MGIVDRMLAWAEKTAQRAEDKALRQRLERSGPMDGTLERLQQASKEQKEKIKKMRE
jgi:hypothetical protein